MKRNVGLEGVIRPKKTFLVLFTHSKQCWVVLTQMWVKYGQTQMLG